MNSCVVLQIMVAMANTHVDTRANHAKIDEALQYQKQQCANYQIQESKKKKSKDFKKESEEQSVSIKAEGSKD